MRSARRGRASALSTGFFGSLAGAVAVLALVVGLTGTSTAQAALTPSARADTLPSATPSTSPVWRPPSGGHFNNPFGSRAAQRRVEDVIHSAVMHSQPGSTIRISVFSYDRTRMTDALVAAYRRGVRVQMLVNEHQYTREMRRLRNVIGANRARESFIYQCEDGCRGGGFLHSKFYLFSDTGGGNRSMMVGSHNLTQNAILHQMNDLLVVNQATGLYGAFVALFEQMRKDRAASPMYRVWRPDNGRRYTLHAFPKFDGYKPSNDPVIQILNKVRCTGAAGSLNTGGRTVIRADNARISGRRGNYIARKLIALWGAGCNVKIMHASVDSNLRTVMNTKTRRGLIPARSDGFDYDNDGLLDMYTHQKFFSIRGNWNGNPKANVLVTGSPNWADIAFHGDEVMIKVTDASRLTYQWNRNFDFIWKYHSRTAPYRGWRSNLRSVDGSVAGTADMPLDAQPGGKYWEND